MEIRKGEPVNRSKTKTFLPQDGSFVRIKNYDTKLFRIAQINKEGLVFRYVAKTEDSLIEISELDIVRHSPSTDSNALLFSLHGVQFDVIGDSVIAEEPASNFSLRSCSVKFRKLNDFHVMKLDSFIKHHTILKG